MRLAEDDRGRVPFALLGVLLLVGSATFSGAVSTRDPVADRSVDAAMDRVSAQADAAMRSAVRDAARAAAANPVTSRADTTVGRALSANETFRDYLRLRIALAASDRLRRVAAERGDVRATASLPAPTNASSLDAALTRVAIDARANGTLLVVTVEGVSLAARRGGRVVADEMVTSRVAVRTPVLALHDRTERFERRLGADALDGGTMDATVTTALWTTAWVRGWSQHAGAPIENVVANDHAALAANAGVLLSERQAFGTADADARGAFGRAVVRTGARSLLAESGVPAAPELAGALPAPNELDESPPSTVPRNRTIEAAVGTAADHAFVSVVDGRGAGSLGRVVAETHRADVRVVADVTRLERSSDPPASPGAGWELVDASTETATATTALPTRTPPSSPGDTVVDAGSRRVTTTRTTTRTWRRGNETLTSRAAATTRHRVDVAVVLALRSAPGPSRPVDPVLSPGGALDGENFASARGVAADVVSTRGGFDGLARAAVAGEAFADRPVVAPESPGLRSWLRADLLRLHDRVRNRTRRVSAREVASGAANPAAELAAGLRADRDALVDAPDSYDGVADRTRVALRAAYLDRVVAELDRRANRTAGSRDAADEAARDADVGSLSAAVAAERTARRTLSSPDANASRRPAGGVRFVPDADPMYLSLDGLPGESMPTVHPDATYHPLVARNTNLFTVPYGDVTDTVLAPVFGARRRVPLRVAARALLAADATLAAANDTDETLSERRERLAVAVERATVPTEEAARRVLRDHTDLNPTDRTAALDAGFGRWGDPAHRALAVTNGSVARAIAVDAAGAGTVEADVLELRLADAFRTARRNRRSSVPQRLTNRTVHRTRTARQDAVAGAATDLVTDATEDAVASRVNETLDERFDTRFERVPAGLPVAPVPGYWYATVNVWDVAVAGEFAQFRVHARGDTESLTYARDGSAVELDWDGDGEAERVGRGDRVGFETRTTVVVAVPPSGVGVGDVDGDADERSAGWPGGPGCVAPGDCRGETVRARV